jgi:putative hydrolase of the HAD superfamily
VRSRHPGGVGIATALVLDFGGVISRTAFETHDMSERLLGLPSGSLKWRGPFDTDTDPLWVDMLAGRITERQYWCQRTCEVGRMLGEEWTQPQDFMRRTQAADLDSSIRPEAIAAVHAARDAGLRLAILSNEMDLFFGADFRQRLPLLNLFDAIIDATYTGILKPDPRAYQACAAALDMDVGECLMVDDQPRNVTGALDAGMQAVRFDVLQPAECFEGILQRLLVPSRPVEDCARYGSPA